MSISDRASSGVYEDKGIPGLTEWFTAALSSPWRFETRLIPDVQPVIERALVAQHPGLDRARLAALIVRARAERASGSPPHAYRELFRELKALD